MKKPEYSDIRGRHYTRKQAGGELSISIATSGKRHLCNAYILVGNLASAESYNLLRELFILSGKADGRKKVQSLGVLRR